MLFCFGDASPFIDRAPCACARDPVRIRRRQCLPPYSRYINLMPMTLTRSQGFSSLFAVSEECLFYFFKALVG